MGTNYQRQILSSIARMANRLAHHSTGELRAWAFRTKVDSVSELIIRGWVIPNCKRPNDTVGITIDGKPLVHVPLHLLKPEARACILWQIRSIRVTVPLEECLDLGELQALRVAGRVSGEGANPSRPEDAG